MIRYVSTRSPGDYKSFLDVMMTGLAPDGGLYVPDSWPDFSHETLKRLGGAPYTHVAASIMTPFIGNSVPPDMLQRVLAKTYETGAFNHAAIAPLSQIGPSAWVLELFHGPTLSFKDYALQFIGQLFDEILGQQGQKLTIVGATSGDTGSAAIEACRKCKNISMFILHPKDRTSEVQRRQMTTVDEHNIFNIAIEGTFDDCQALVKAMLSDQRTMGDIRLSAINSINWARIMAQIVYYVAAAITLGAPDRPVSFAVPTGNFGNVYAAWAARQIGVPIHNLIIGSNRNDILTRFFETGEMKMEKVMPSLSPSMDIQVSSNFERYLFDLMNRDCGTIQKIMNSFRDKKSFILPPEKMARARRDFTAGRCEDAETLTTMRECYEQTGMLIDPHTAVGLRAAMENAIDPTVPMVTLACAHPAKFPDAVEQATGIRPPLPPHLADLMEMAENYVVLPNDLVRVSSYIRTETHVHKLV